MVLCGYLSLAITVPAKIVSALQHLAAGIVLSAVAVELRAQHPLEPGASFSQREPPPLTVRACTSDAVPIISDAPNDLGTTMSITVGFAVGITLFLLIGKFCSADADEYDEDDEDRKRSSSL